MSKEIVEPYIPSQEALEFVAFIRASGVEDNSNAEIHYKLADKYFSRHKQVVIESFRGSAKSTIMQWFVIYAAVKGKVDGFGSVKFIAFVGDSAENGVKNFFRNVATKIDRSPFIQQYITVQRKTDAEMELVNIAGNQLNIKGFGMRTNIRGVSYKGDRPDIVILDDTTTNEAMTSDVIQQTINDNFYKSIIPALHPTKFKLFVIGTPISENDLLSQLSENPKWIIHKFPICEKFPCLEEDFVGNWEDRFPFESVQDKYDTYKGSGQLQDFYQEYMLQLTDLSTLLVEEEDIKWYTHADIMMNRDAYNIYISSDFATSQKKSADFSTIGVWAVSSNNDWILIDGICKRQTMPDNIDKIFEYVQKYKPISVGIESSGQQGGFIDIMEDRMIKTNNWFTFAKKPGSKDPGIRPVKDKMHRFVTGVQPKFKQNKVWLPRIDDLVSRGYGDLYTLVNELDDELSKFTSAAGVKALKHDDAIDLLNQLSEMDKYLPSAEFTFEKGITQKSVKVSPNNLYQMEQPEDSGGCGWDSYM